MRTLQNVAPTPEQLKLFSRVVPGVEVIRGAAGSGKTSTAILKMRAILASFLSRKQRQKRTDPLQVLILTYNRTLRGYIAELVQNQFTATPEINLQITTFGKWSWELLGRPAMLEDHEKVLSGLAADLALSPQFIAEEVDYALGRFLPADLDNYLAARRHGRGGTPRVERPTRQELLDKVVAPYQVLKGASGRKDWNDLAVELATTRVAAYDIVIVDETQDLSANQIRAVMNQLMAEHSVTFILDSAQRIYARAFSWNEVGISVRPENSFRLANNYRNTREIAAFAIGLLDGIPNDDDGTMPNFQAATRAGPLPQVLIGRFSHQIAFALSHIESNVDLNVETVAFLHLKGGGWFKEIRTQLSQAGLGFAELTAVAEWPAGPENIALSTFHSAKGLEFDHVVIIGLSGELLTHGDEDDDSQLNALRRLLAMGIGRARKTVVIGYSSADVPKLAEFFAAGTFESITAP